MFPGQKINRLGSLPRNEPNDNCARTVAEKPLFYTRKLGFPGGGDAHPPSARIELAAAALPAALNRVLLWPIRRYRLMILSGLWLPYRPPRSSENSSGAQG